MPVPGARERFVDLSGVRRGGAPPDVALRHGTSSEGAWIQGVRAWHSLLLWLGFSGQRRLWFQLPMRQLNYLLPGAAVIPGIFYPMYLGQLLLYSSSTYEYKLSLLCACNCGS